MTLSRPMAVFSLTFLCVMLAVGMAGADQAERLAEVAPELAYLTKLFGVFNVLAPIGGMLFGAGAVYAVLKYRQDSIDRDVRELKAEMTKLRDLIIETLRSSS